MAFGRKCGARDADAVAVDTLVTAAALDRDKLPIPFFRAVRREKD